MKLCKYCNKYKVFSHGYCKYHQWVWKQQVPSNRHGQIKPISSKRYPSTTKKLSSKKRTILALNQKHKKELQIINQNRCFFCGLNAHDLVHIFPVSLFPKYDKEEWNHILGCRTCHIIFDDCNPFTLNNSEFIIDLIQAVDIKYYHRLLNRKTND